MSRRKKVIQFIYNQLSASAVRDRGDAPRIRLITGYDEAIAAYGDIAASNHAAYARSHGYDHRVYRSGFDTARPPAWSKIRFILRSLRGTDWVVWLDADTIITDPGRPLTRFISTRHDLILARHQSPILHANTGVMFLRNRLWIRFLLHHVYAQTQVIHHGWWEQMGLLVLLDGYHLPRVGYTKAREFNSLYRSDTPTDVYQPGDFLVHFAGIGDRARLMAEFARTSALLP